MQILNPNKFILCFCLGFATFIIPALSFAAVGISAIDDTVFTVDWDVEQTSIQIDDDVCVFHDIATAPATAGTSGNYYITATGNGTGNSFKLTSGANETPYHVWWRSGIVGAFTELTSSTSLNGQTGANTTSNDCSGGTSLNATIRIVMLATDLSQTVAGSYSGSLSLLIGPE